MNSFNDIKIRPTILLVIFLLIATTASISLFIQYYSSKDLAYSSTVKLIDETSEKMQENVEKFDEISHDIISLLELSKDIDIPQTRISGAFQSFREPTSGYKSFRFLNIVFASSRFVQDTKRVKATVRAGMILIRTYFILSSDASIT